MGTNGNGEEIGWNKSETFWPLVHSPPARLHVRACGEEMVRFGTETWMKKRGKGGMCEGFVSSYKLFSFVLISVDHVHAKNVWRSSHVTSELLSGHLWIFPRIKSQESSQYAANHSCLWRLIEMLSRGESNTNK